MNKQLKENDQKHEQELKDQKAKFREWQIWTLTYRRTMSKEMIKQLVSEFDKKFEELM